MGLLRDIFSITAEKPSKPTNRLDSDSDLISLYKNYFGHKPKSRITDDEKDELLNFLEDEWEDEQ